MSKLIPSILVVILFVMSGCSDSNPRVPKTKDWPEILAALKDAENTINTLRRMNSDLQRERDNAIEALQKKEKELDEADLERRKMETDILALQNEVQHLHSLEKERLSKILAMYK